MDQPDHPRLPPKVILYDGVCGFCNWAVQWVLRADTTGRFYFAPLQGSTATAVRRRHPEIPDNLDSIIYVETTDDTEHVSWHADAIFRVCAQLPGPAQAFAWLRWLPRCCADHGYRWFASHRYRWFGKLDNCPLPRPEQRARFLP